MIKKIKNTKKSSKTQKRQKNRKIQRGPNPEKVGAQRAGGPKGGGSKGGSPKVEGPNFRVFPFLALFSLCFSLSLWRGLLVDFGGVFEGQDRQMCTARGCVMSSVGTADVPAAGGTSDRAAVPSGVFHWHPHGLGARWRRANCGSREGRGQHQR